MIFTDFHAVRQFVQLVNQKKDLINYPETAWKTGQVNSMGLIDEILHFVFNLYRQQQNPALLSKTTSHLVDHFGQKTLDQIFKLFLQEFPPNIVYSGEMNIEDYLRGETNGENNREIVLEEMLMLWMENSNPALIPYEELFNDQFYAKMPSICKYSTRLKSLRKHNRGSDHCSKIL